MRDKELDDILRQATDSPDPLDPAMLDRISGSLAANLQPVSPLPAPGVLVAALLFVSSAVAGITAAILGFNGIVKLTLAEGLVIFGLIAALLWLAARLSVAETVPGALRPIGPWQLAVTACVSLAAAFALLVQDHSVDAFVREGIRCLRAGAGVAALTAVAVWWILRRGVVLDGSGAGHVFGILSGLSGVLMLELHCPKVEAPHLMVWHVGVIVVTVATGSILGRILARR